MTPPAPAAELTPAYLQLGLEELESRAQRAVDELASCRVCPRNCDVNRLEDELISSRGEQHSRPKTHDDSECPFTQSHP